MGADESTGWIHMYFAQAPEDPKQPHSASSGKGFYPQDDWVCAFLPERHKNPSNPVNPVRKCFHKSKLVHLSDQFVYDIHMPINTNTWNRIRYTLYAPFYDLVARWFAKQRRRSIELLDLKAGEKVLLVGAGTGLDLEFLPKDVTIEANDITPAMVHHLARRAKDLGLEVRAEVMDGQDLQYEAESFDAVILHLILAIIPDPILCIREVERVLKKGGRAVIFDKFLPDDQQPSWGRKFLNLFANVIATNITRQLGPILGTTSLKIVHREPAGFGGLFKIALVRKEV